MTPRIGFGPVHHHGYVVEDVRQAAQQMVALGAGPFFLADEVPLERVTSAGEPAAFRHGSTFGVWNGSLIELMQIAEVGPPSVASQFGGPRPRVHHVAWALPLEEAEAARADLDRSGVGDYLHGYFGEIDFTYHDARHLLGHDVEIHVGSEMFEGFFAPILASSECWRGDEAIRPMVH